MPPTAACSARKSLVLGEVEIEEQRLTLGADQNVGRLDVSVQDAAVMGVLESVGELSDDPGRGLEKAGARSRTTGVRPSPGDGEAGTGAGFLSHTRIRVLMSRRRLYFPERLDELTSLVEDFPSSA